jgi:hypothetical protein
MSNNKKQKLNNVKEIEGFNKINNSVPKFSNFLESWSICMLSKSQNVAKLKKKSTQ